MKLKTFFKMLWVPVFLIMQACVEPIELATENYQSALVIESTITTELKRQEIQLSRTFRLEEDAPTAEINADVFVEDDRENEYLFEETSPGKYLSLTEFQAKTGRSYSLYITTAAGRTYRSEPQQVPQNSEIAQLYAERTTFRGEDGVALLVDIESDGASSGYYRYAFEETYKVVSPFSFRFDLFYRDGRFVEVLKTKEERVCYATEASNEIILANTNSQAGNSLEHFLVRFIDSDDSVLAYRYSILVKQYVISEEVYSFYETLKEFSGPGGLFSQNQPGFVNGNIVSVEDPDEKVIGVFSVAAVNEERLFFSFEDFFASNESPPLGIECDISRPAVSPPPLDETLGEMLNSGRVKYLGTTIVGGKPNEGPYRVVQAECVDCTLRGTNEVPEFWIED